MSYDRVAMKNCSNSNLVVVVIPTATYDFDLTSETTMVTLTTVNETWLIYGCNSNNQCTITVL